MDALLISDGDFSSLCRACGYLYRLHLWKDHYGEAGKLDDEQLLSRVFDRVVRMLPAMNTVDDRGLDEVQESISLMYQLTMRPEFSDHRERFQEALEMLVSQNPIHPGLLGSALGMLYGLEPEWKARIDDVVRGYLQGTRTMMLQSAQLLQGLFFTARDILLTDGEFLKRIDGLLCALEDEDFTAMLPQLRLAFSYFLPRETDRLAKAVGLLHGGAAIRKDLAVDAADYSRAEAVDAWAAAHLEDWGDEYGDL
jgi:hypothetical protein